MPLTTYTGLADMAEVVPTELLGQFIAAYAYEPRVADSIAWIRPGVGNTPVRYPRWSAAASVPSGTVAETVDSVDVEVDLTESSITPGMVRFRMPISDEVAVQALSGIPAGALVHQMEALLNRMDVDALAASTAATQTVGAITTAFDLAAFRAMRQAYRALRLRGSMHALALHDDALNALENDIQVSASPLAIRPDDKLAISVSSAFQGNIGGFNVFLSGNIAAETTGNSNFATPMGADSGLGVVLNNLPSVVTSRGDEAELRAVTFYFFRAWYGVGLANPTRFLEVLSS